MAIRKSMGLPTKPLKAAKPATVAKEAKPPAQADYRTGRLQFSFWIPQEAKEQIDIWAAKNRKTRQFVGEEAINAWFASVGLNRIARPEE